MDPRTLRAYQQALATLAQSANRDVAQLWRLLQREGDPVFVRDALEDALPALVEQYGVVAGELSAEWFTALDPSDGFRPVVAAPPGGEQVARNAAWAAQPLFAGKPSDALTRLTGVTTKHLYASGRNTVIANSERLGTTFARVARVQGCPFCRMLAGRGFVYSDEEAAGGVNPDDYHDHCKCTVIPKRRGISESDVPNLSKFRDEYMEARAGIDVTGSKEALRTILSRMSTAS